MGGHVAASTAVAVVLPLPLGRCDGEGVGKQSKQQATLVSTVQEKFTQGLLLVAKFGMSTHVLILSYHRMCYIRHLWLL